jgi:hypothetical protein
MRTNCCIDECRVSQLLKMLETGFPDAFQLERVRESMMRRVAANGQHFEHLM